MREEVVGKVSSLLAFNVSYSSIPEDYTLPDYASDSAASVHIYHKKDKFSKVQETDCWTRLVIGRRIHIN